MPAAISRSSARGFFLSSRKLCAMLSPRTLAIFRNFGESYTVRRGVALAVLAAPGDGACRTRAARRRPGLRSDSGKARRVRDPAAAIIGGRESVAVVYR